MFFIAVRKAKREMNRWIKDNSIIWWNNKFWIKFLTGLNRFRWKGCFVISSFLSCYGCIRLLVGPAASSICFSSFSLKLFLQYYYPFLWILITIVSILSWCCGCGKDLVYYSGIIQNNLWFFGLMSRGI